MVDGTEARLGGTENFEKTGLAEEKPKTGYSTRRCQVGPIDNRDHKI